MYIWSTFPECHFTCMRQKCSKDSLADIEQKVYVFFRGRLLCNPPPAPTHPVSILEQTGLDWINYAVLYLNVSHPLIASFSTGGGGGVTDYKMIWYLTPASVICFYTSFNVCMCMTGCHFIIRLFDMLQKIDPYIALWFTDHSCSNNGDATNINNLCYSR